MSSAPSMPVFPDALIGDTTHLSAEEFGAYCLLLFKTWSNNGIALPDDDRLARVCRVTARRWRERIRPALIGFFDLADGCWHQKRLEKEWQFVAKRVDISRTNGARGGRPKSLKPNGSENPAGSSQVMQNESTYTYTYKKKDSEDSNESSAAAAAPAQRVADPIKELWDSGVELMTNAGVSPKQARTMIGKWRREFGDAACTAAFAAAKDNLATEPISFISACLQQSRNGANGHGRKTAASERFDRGTQVLLDAVERAEKRDRERDARHEEGDCGRATETQSSFWVRRDCVASGG